NLTRVYFRAIPSDYEQRLRTARHRPEYLSEQEQKALPTAKPVREWSADLPPTADFQERVEKLPAPTDRQPGFYFLVASHDPAFGADNNQVAYASFWVSKLALVMRPHRGTGVMEGFVLDAISGKPLAGAEVKVWYCDRARVRSGRTVKTVGNGLFRFTDFN